MNTAIDIQIKQMYEKAFYDIIDEAVNSDKPDYEWILRLYSEIKGRLMKYIKPESKVYKKLDEEFDISLFKQMIENNVFNADSMVKLVNTTYYWIKFLGAPVRDDEVEKSKERVLTSESTKIVSTFVKESNQCIDYIEEDIINYIQLTKKE